MGMGMAAGWEACNWQERILVPRQFTRPRLHFGSTFQTLVTSSNLHPQVPPPSTLHPPPSMHQKERVTECWVGTGLCIPFVPVW